jgi:hypothetical protein
MPTLFDPIAEQVIAILDLFEQILQLLRVMDDHLVAIKLPRKATSASLSALMMRSTSASIMVTPPFI